MFRNKGQSNDRQFKKTIDDADAARRRTNMTVELRQDARAEQVAKRRYRNKEQEGKTSDPKKVLTVQDIPSLLQKAASNLRKDQFEAAQGFRQILSVERQPPITQVIRCGVVGRLVEFLGFSDRTDLQFEACWALTNIVSSTSAHTLEVTKIPGAIKAFVNLLHSTNQYVQEQAVWALGNIAGDGAAFRDAVLQQGAMRPLLALCTAFSRLTLLRNAAWTISNLCRGKEPNPPPFEIVSLAIPTLADLLNIKDQHVLMDTCWSLSYLCDDEGPFNREIQCVLDADVAPMLVEHLGHASVHVQTPALRTIGNLVTGDTAQTDTVLRAGVLDMLQNMLHSPIKNIKKEACWAISNITAGSKVQIAQVIESGIIPKLVNLLHGRESDVKREAAWAISNATTGGSDESIRRLVKAEVIAPLCALLDPADDISIVAMEGLENILRVGNRLAHAQGNDGKNPYCLAVEDCGGVEMLQDFSMSSNNRMFLKAKELLEENFERFDSEDEHDFDEDPVEASTFSWDGQNNTGNQPAPFQFNNNVAPMHNMGQQQNQQQNQNQNQQTNMFSGGNNMFNSGNTPF